MKPSLTFMDFLIVFVLMIGVSVIAHYSLSHKIDVATGKVMPTLFGGKKEK